MSDRVALYTQIRDLPTVDAGQLSSDDSLAFVTHSQVDLRDPRKKFKRTFVSTYSAHTGAGVSVPSDVGDALLYSVSPSGTRVAVVRQSSADEPAKGAAHVDHLLELFHAGRRVLRLPLNKLHHKVHNDGFHGYVAWSSDEHSLAYVADAKRSKAAPFFSDAERDADALAGAEHAFVDDFGELLTGKSLGRIFVVDLRGAGSVRQVGADAGSPAAALSLGQPTFAPSGTELAFTGWVVEPFRLGMLACFNRRSFVFVVSLTDASAPVRRVGPADDAAMHRSPRFTPRGDGVVLLATENRLAHASTSSLLFSPLADLGQLRPVVAVVQKPASTDAFPGLYLAQLPARPWLSDDVLVCGTTWWSAQAVVQIDVRTGAVERVPVPVDAPNAVLSADVLDVRADRVLVVSSTPTRPPSVLKGARGTDGAWRWTALDTGAPSPALPQDAWTAALAKCATSVHQLSAGGHTFEYILLLPPVDGDAKLRTIFFPHGGPHVATPAAYTATTAFFLLSGYAVIMPNYRGSTGQGEAALSSLLGKAGENDVADCFAALVDALNKNAQLDAGAVYVFGGSHGGFLGAHSIARTFTVASAPDTAQRFRACAIRNPVINIASMVEVTDIGDWCAAEAGSAEYATMRACSPIARVNDVHTPVLLLVGDADRRVPPSQGTEYYRALKRLGRKVELKVYAGQSHGLANVASMEADGIVNSLLWFDQH